VKFTGYILLAMLLASCDGGSGNRDTNPFHLPPAGFIGDSNTGAALFRQHCSSCHGRAASGSNQGPSLIHKTYNSTHHADLAFHLAVKNGVRRHHWRYGDMPALPTVSPESVGHIVAYVRAIQLRAGIN
jgi:mono/diheme cytochrome c family protein